MPLDFTTYPAIEKVGHTHSPGRAGFSFESARATLPYYCKPDSLENNLKIILGSVIPDGVGGLSRGLPSAHPRYTWLYASNVNTIESFGHHDGTNRSARVTTETYLEAPPITNSYMKYLVDEYTIEFTPRPYALIDDSSIRAETETITWQDQNDSTTTITVNKEWLRYTDFVFEPAAEFITANQGQMVFVRDDSDIDPAPSGTSNLPHGVALTGFPKILLNKSIIKFTWFQVPYSFVVSANSRLFSYAGMVNQLDWYGVPKGELLYMGFSAKRYVPPVPERVMWPGGAAFSTAKVCDIEMTFLRVKRTTPAAPTPSKIRWVAKGHNLHPWFGTREYFYVIMPDPAALNDESKWRPTYESAPFQMLFVDPDIVP